MEYVTPSCWTTDEKADLEFAELDSLVILSFKDAVDCTPISDATVKIFDFYFQSDQTGSVRLPAGQFENIESQKIDILVEKKAIFS